MSRQAAVRYETLRAHAESETLCVTLDRPEEQNAINGTMVEELHAVLDEAEDSPECRLVVLQGANGVFCAGMDFAAAGTQDELSSEVSARDAAETFIDLLGRLTEFPKVVLARVDGRVAGGGVGLVAASDLAYASERSTFGLPEALWGLLPCCVLPFLIRRAGFQPAYAMALSTLPMTAAEARESRLVDAVTDDADEVIGRLRQRLTRMDGSTVGDLKTYARRMWFLSEQMERTAVEEFSRLMTTPAVRERISALVAGQSLPWESRT
jgi:polyketide biosynthesis enoyl-CoA hydratase PksH